MAEDDQAELEYRRRARGRSSSLMPAPGADDGIRLPVGDADIERHGNRTDAAAAATR